MYVPVETDKRTTTNCTRTCANMCACTQLLGVYTLTQRITLSTHSVLLLQQEGKQLWVRAHLYNTFVLYAQGVFFLYAHWQSSAQKSAQQLCRTRFWWNRISFNKTREENWEKVPWRLQEDYNFFQKPIQTAETSTWILLKNDSRRLSLHI